MKSSVFVVVGLLLTGCASTVSPEPQSPVAGPWSRVMRLDWRAEVSVTFDCPEEAGEAGLPPGVEAIQGGCRIGGNLLQATSASILVRPKTPPDAPVAEIARSDVSRILGEQRRSRQLHTLIGSAIGLAFCAFAGLYGDRAHDLDFSGKVVATGMCVGGGAALGYLGGYLGDRDPPTLKLIYERPGPTTSRNSLVARGRR